MTTLEHVVLFEAAKPSRWERVNAPLGKRGFWIMVVLALLVLPISGWAAFSTASQLAINATGVAADGAETTFVDDVSFDCRKVAGAGTVVSCAIAVDGKSIDLALTDIDDDFQVLVEATVRNDGPVSTCLQAVPLSVWGAVVNNNVDVLAIIGPASSRVISNTFSADLVIPNQDLAQTIDYLFDDLGCI